MLRLNGVILQADHTQDDLKISAAHVLKIPVKDIISLHIIKRSYDARRKNNILFVYTVDVEISDEEKALKKLKKVPNVKKAPDEVYRFKAVSDSVRTERPVIVGTGPCGLFCALILAQAGFRPIVLERGKPVRERSADTFGFWRNGTFLKGSNVQFGEGGAGTFSDGKLNTQIKDHGNYGRKVLSELVKAGAPEEILFISKPHVGTFRLVKVVENIRKQIISLGGEFRFGTKVAGIIVENGSLSGIETEDGSKIRCSHSVFAIGHSARDTFEMLMQNGVVLEPKPFSVGFRIEHHQDLINRIRLGRYSGDGRFGAADYKLVHHCSNGRSVYTFCMCPGGRVVAATSEEGCVVTNGMSQYSRSEQNANSAIVVGVGPEDFPGGPLGGIEFQRELERRAFVLGGSDYYAPAQLVGDFLKGVPSIQAGTVKPSYLPGVKFTDLSTALPVYAVKAIKEALNEFDRQMRGFITNDAVLTGVETRTSSPVRILRGEDLQSASVKGLYPGGEGAGYAGGIMSAAIDGIKIAETVSVNIVKEDESL